MNKISPSELTRASLLGCAILFSGCAHVVVHTAAETQPGGKNPVTIAMPPLPSDEPKIIIHEPGVDLSTPDIWLGVFLALLLSVAR